MNLPSAAPKRARGVNVFARLSGTGAGIIGIRVDFSNQGTLC
jgi:hypothetical protein